MRDLHNNIHIKRAISPQEMADTTPIVSQIIDGQGFDGLEFLIATGALPDADATFVVLVEHGDDSGLSDNAAVPDTMLLGTEAEAGFAFGDDDKVFKIGYVGDKRYTRLTITPADLAAGAELVGVLAVLGFPRHAPTPLLT